MKKLNLLIASGWGESYSTWFPVEDINIVTDMHEADLVLFTGGEDVDPSIYHESKGSRTYSNLKRDSAEMEVYEEALKYSVKMIGICRGSQFLCCMAGGTLVQHMSHPSQHEINTWDGKVLRCVSTHHQMQFPYRLPSSEYRVIGWANKISNTYLNGDNTEFIYQGKILKMLEKFAEPEIVYYPHINALAIQSHPEMMSKDSEMVKYCQKLLTDFMEDKIS